MQMVNVAFHPARFILNDRHQRGGKKHKKFETLIFVSTNRDSKISSERGFQRKQIGGQTPTEKLWQQAAAQGVCANELNYSTGTRSTTAIGCDDESSSPQRPDSVPRKVRAQTF